MIYGNEFGIARGVDVSFYVWETRVKHARYCENCSKGFNEGYLHEDNGLVFCSFYCSTKHYGQAGAIKLRQSGDLFWTEWEESE